MAWLQTNVPQYKYQLRNKKVLIASNGTATGVHINITAAHTVKMMWMVPNMGLQMLLILITVFTLLPGLLIWLIVWQVTKSGTEQMKQVLGQALHTGQPAVAGGQHHAMPGAQAPNAYPGSPQLGSPNPGGPGAPGLVAGQPVTIQTPDGQSYPGTFVQAQGGQAQCRFENGQEGWYPEGSVQAR